MRIQFHCVLKTNCCQRTSKYEPCHPCSGVRLFWTDINKVNLHAIIQKNCLKYHFLSFFHSLFTQVIKWTSWQQAEIDSRFWRQTSLHLILVKHFISTAWVCLLGNNISLQKPECKINCQNILLRTKCKCANMVIQTEIEDENAAVTVN